MKRFVLLLKKEPMLSLSLLAAALGLFITRPSVETLSSVDWRTLGTLFMMLCVLEGFKREEVLKPVEKLASKLGTLFAISLFLVFGVFFTSMFVTNDVSLIIFVPLTISIFRKIDRQRYILPVISFENIAAIRGSLLMPFGSPQNLFLYGQAEDLGFGRFVLHMAPLAVMSAALLIVFVAVLYRKNIGEKISCDLNEYEDTRFFKPRRLVYVILFVLVLLVIVSRTRLWWAALILVLVSVFAVDKKLLLRVDYVLLITFLCFFVFSSSVAANEKIAAFLGRTVAGREYWWAIGLSQVISNVPASIVLYPFTRNFAGLIYGADTAGLCSIIGSLASVINYRIYVREYPGNGGKFVKTFTLISWAFFIIVVVPGFLLSKWDFFA